MQTMSSSSSSMAAAAACLSFLLGTSPRGASSVFRLRSPASSVEDLELPFLVSVLPFPLAAKTFKIEKCFNSKPNYVFTFFPILFLAFLGLREVAHNFKFYAILKFGVVVENDLDVVVLQKVVARQNRSIG